MVDKIDTPVILKSLLLFLLFAIPIHAIAQDTNEQKEIELLFDSATHILNSGNPKLLKEISKEGRRLASLADDTDRYLMFTYYLGASYYNINLDSGIHYLEMGLRQSAKSDQLLRAKCLNSLGNFYRKKGQYGLALTTLKEGKEIIEKTNLLKKDIYLGSFNGKLGALFKDLGEYQKSIELQIETLQIWERNNDLRRMSITSNDIGVLFKYLKKYDAALSSLNDARRLAVETNNQSLLSKVYANIAEILLAQNTYDSALVLLQSSIRIKEEIDIEPTETYLLLVDAFLKHGDTHDAQLLLQKLSSREWENETWYLNYLLLQGKLELSHENRQKSIEYGERALMIAKSLENDVMHIRVLKFLAKAYHSLGNNSRAFELMNMADEIGEQLITEQNIKSVENARIVYETEKKETEIRDLTQRTAIQELQIGRRNLWMGIICIAFLFVGIVAYLVYRQLQFKKENETNGLKQKLLRVQLNPHFMFNSLNAIQNMIFRSVDKHRTADYLARFSHLTRQILELNQRDFITLKDELKFIENYLSIQQIRFDEPFGYSIIIDDEVEADSTMIPPMITQPFLENAIEHGIINKKDKGNIRLIVTTGDTHLHLKIEDNGVGREKAAFAKKVESHRSLATEITQDRLANLTKSFRKEAFMNIEDIFDGELVCGTRVHFTLPLNFMNT